MSEQPHSKSQLRRMAAQQGESFALEAALDTIKALKAEISALKDRPCACQQHNTVAMLRDENDRLRARVSALETEGREQVRLSFKENARMAAEASSGWQSRAEQAEKVLAEWAIIGKELGAGYPENTVSVMVQAQGLNKKLTEAESRLTQAITVLEGAKQIMEAWTLAPWTSPTGKDGEPPCLSKDFWRYTMGRTHESLSALRAFLSGQPGAGTKEGA